MPTKNQITLAIFPSILPSMLSKHSSFWTTNCPIVKFHINIAIKPGSQIFYA